jgi:FkbM family methyltransferase
MKKQVTNYDYNNEFVKANNLEYRIGPNMNGKWLWPVEDTLCWEFFNKFEIKEWGPNNHLPNEVLKLLPKEKRKLIIQAGGNSGFYPSIYSHSFERVITFEPDYRWFTCLIHNANKENIFKFQSALGNDNIPITLVAPYLKGKENLGALYIENNGVIPKIKIDSLGCDPDCIHLDIEGSEWEALLGAVETIKRAKPMIVVEWNQSGQRYGWSDDKIENMFQDLDYILYKEWPRDRSYIHKDRINEYV